jgi:hypothetical protein
MAQHARSTALVGLGCALAGTVLGWQVREARGPGWEPPEAARALSVHGLELLPPVLEVGLTGPWSEAPRPLPGAPRWLEDPGPLREWHEGFRALNAGVERPPPLGPALAEAFLATPELFLTQYASRFDVPALDLYGPRPGTNKGQERVASSRQPKKDGGSLPAGGRLLALCAGLSMAACSAVQVREADAEWLEDCPPEAVTAMRGLKFGIPYGIALTFVGDRTQTPFAIREGPMVAWGVNSDTYNIDSPETLARVKRSKLFGQAKRYGDRMSVRFDLLRLRGGEEFPVCAVSYDIWGQQPGLERWGPGSHPGVDVSNDAPEFLAWLETLGPGEFPIAGPTRISFGAFLRPEYVTLR